MQFQCLDLVVVAIMLISGLLALARGFTREVLSLIAWGVAGLAGLASALNPQIVAAAQQYIPQEIAAKIAVGAGVFLVVADHHVADQHQDLRLGARCAGRRPSTARSVFVYGLARGLLLVVIAYFFYDLFVPRDKQDEAVQHGPAPPGRPVGAQHRRLDAAGADPGAHPEHDIDRARPAARDRAAAAGRARRGGPGQRLSRHPAQAASTR